MKNEKKWDKCKETNRISASYSYPKDEVVFLDLQDHFRKEDGTLKESTISTCRRIARVEG